MDQVRLFAELIPRLRKTSKNTCIVVASPELSLEASGLTYYTLLSLVPVFAFIFGIAKGFGLESFVSEQIRTGFSEHQQVAELLLQFSQTLLSQAKGGVIAGVGILALLWSSIKLLSHIERSLNLVWSASSARPFFRKFSDYLAVLLIFPFLLLISTSLALVLQSEVIGYLEQFTLLRPLATVLSFTPHFTPFLLLIAAFTFLYSFFPNRRVPLSSALSSAVFATLGVVVIQAVFVRSQLFFAQFGAVYGSFSALPLFLLWLYLTWIVILTGAHFGFQLHESRYSFDHASFGRFSRRERELHSLFVCSHVAQIFFNQKKPAEKNLLLSQTGLSAPLLDSILTDLSEKGVLVEIREEKKIPQYLPAVPLEDFRPSFILNTLSGHDSLPSVSERSRDSLAPFSNLLNGLSSLISSSALDRPIHLLLDESSTRNEEKNELKERSTSSCHDQ